MFLMDCVKFYRHSPTSLDLLRVELYPGDMKILQSSMTLQLGYLLEHGVSMLHRQSDQVLQERLGIGMSQFKLLLILQEHPNVQQRVVAETLGQTEASISRQIKILCQKGMLAIQVNPNNRRQHLTVATPKGIKVAQAALEVLAEYHNPVFDQFSEKQQKQLAEILQAMHQVICAPGKPHACTYSIDVE